LGEPEGFGSADWLPWLSKSGESSGSIKVDVDFMSPELDGIVIATARERTEGWWEVSHWPRFFDRNRAITALTVTELLHGGRDHPR
jgi:hypothetical protein